MSEFDFFNVFFFILLLILIVMLILFVVSIFKSLTSLEGKTDEEIAKEIKDIGTAVAGTIEFFQGIGERDPEKIRKATDIASERLSGQKKKSSNIE